MLKIACLNINNLEVSDIEVKLNKNISAIEAFKLIEEAYPKADKYFLIGADNFINILKWKGSRELISKYKYIVFEREKVDLVKYIRDNLKDEKTDIYIVKNSEYRTISSSKFREILNEELLPEKVVKYIKENGIYLKEQNEKVKSSKHSKG